MTTASDLGTQPAIVLDTNVLISAALFRQSASTDAVEKALNQFTPVFTLVTWDELASVIMRSKLDRYLTPEARHLYLAKLASMARVVEARSTVNDCRDPKDNKFLAIALDAQAAFIVTGDSDLLVLHPYADITLCTPAAFLNG